MLVDQLAQALQMLGQFVRIVASNGNLDEDIKLAFNDDSFETLENGVPTTYLKRRNYFFPPTFYFTPKLQAWLITNLDQFDVVVIHGVWTYFSLMGSRLCQKLNKPYLFFVHGSFDPWAINYHRLNKILYWHLLEKQNLKKSNGIIVLSQDEAAQVKRMGIIKPMFRARNGLLLPVQRVNDAEGVLANQIPELSNHPFVFYMSRLHPKKGLAVLLHAWSQICSNHPEWRLVIAGPDEGGYLTQLISTVEELNLQHSVIFTGLVSGEVKAAFLQKAEIFVLPSFSEGVPGSVIEAMSFGLPVLITPGCHLPEVAEAQAGLIVEPEKMVVAEGLECLINDSGLRKKMEKNAEELARQQFDETKVAAGLVSFCQSLIDQKA